MLKASIQWYRERGTKGVDNGLKKIHDKITLMTIDKSSFTQERHTYALRAIMFLKDKLCGNIKD